MITRLSIAYYNPVYRPIGIERELDERGFPPGDDLADWFASYPTDKAAMLARRVDSYDMKAA
jgi:hypothetical protein